MSLEDARYRRGDDRRGGRRDPREADRARPARRRCGRPSCSDPTGALFDEATDRAVRAFQQQRGIPVDGIVGPQTYHALDEARWRLGDRILFYVPARLMAGDDVAALQQRLLDMGFDCGRVDGLFGVETEQALREFQRNVGVVRRRHLRAGHLQGAQPAHPHGRRRPPARDARLRGDQPGRARRWRASCSSSTPVTAGRRRARRPASGRRGRAGLRPGRPDRGAAHRHRLPPRSSPAAPTSRRTARGEESTAPASPTPPAPTCSSRCTSNRHENPRRQRRRVPTTTAATEYGHYSTVGEQLADLVQREICARTDLVDCRVHAKNWDLLRRTRMPAVRIEVGYLTNAGRRRPAGRPGVPRRARRGGRGRGAAALPAGRPGRRHRRPADPRLLRSRPRPRCWRPPVGAAQTGRNAGSGLIEPSSRSRATSTSSRQDSALRRSSRSRGNRWCGRTVLKPTAAGSRPAARSPGRRSPQPARPRSTQVRPARTPRSPADAATG